MAKKRKRSIFIYTSLESCLHLVFFGNQSESINDRLVGLNYNFVHDISTRERIRPRHFGHVTELPTWGFWRKGQSLFDVRVTNPGSGSESQRNVVLKYVLTKHEREKKR